MTSEKFRINTNGQSLRNPSNVFFGMTLSANLTIDESDASAHNDRRTAHNALERQRREHLNTKFQQLAHALPSLQTVRRPSKTMIVSKSLEFVSSSLKRESNYTLEIQRLREENERLKKQAQNASQKLQNQLPDLTIKEENDETDTLVESESCSEKKSLKRKLTQLELSPPLTPETTKPKIKQAPIITTQPKKKRMVKQTKSTNSIIPSYIHQNTTMPSYPFFDITPPPYQQLFTQTETSFQPIINPLLITPYYIPSENNFSYSFIQDNHQRQSSNDSSFYNL